MGLRKLELILLHGLVFNYMDNIFYYVRHEVLTAVMVVVMMVMMILCVFAPRRSTPSDFIPLNLLNRSTS